MQLLRVFNKWIGVGGISNDTELLLSSQLFPPKATVLVGVPQSQ